MPALIFVALGLLTGVIFASQGAINGRLSFHMGGAALAALVSFTVGWVVLFAANLALRPSIPTTASMAAAPWWAYLGGVIGAAGVTFAALAVPKIGVATWMAAVIAGQLIAALVLDQFGIFGLAVREISAGRIVGAICLAAGVWLIHRH